MSTAIAESIAWPALGAQLTCFAFFALASFGRYRQAPSRAHDLTRGASVLTALVFTALAVSDAAPPVWAGLAALLSGLLAGIFLSARGSAVAGVLHVAFADAPSARLVQAGIQRRIRNPFYTAYPVFWGAWCPLLGKRLTGPGKVCGGPADLLARRLSRRGQPRPAIRPCLYGQPDAYRAFHAAIPGLTSVAKFYGGNISFQDSNVNLFQAQ